MMNWLRRQLDCQYMLSSSAIKGSILPTKSIYRHTIDIAWPSAAESLLINLVNSIDTIMVGTISSAAIAAVGITTQPKFLLLAAILSLNFGVTAVIARRTGQKDQDGANRCLHQSLFVSCVLSAALSMLGFVFAHPILRFAGAGMDIIEDAVAYFRINMIGFMVMSAGLTINAALKGAGDTRISMRTNIVANLVNLVLNYLLIGGHFGFPAWGVRGAALATITGQLVAFFMSLRSVRRKNAFLTLSLRGKWLPDWNTMSSVSKISSSAFIEQLFTRLGFFGYSKAVAGLGTIAFATHQICMNVFNLSFGISDGLCTAVGTLVGQSLGEKRPDLAEIYVKTSKVIMFTIAVGLCLTFSLGRYPILRLFTDDAEIIRAGSSIMIVLAATCIFQTMNKVYMGCLRGSGDAKYIAVTAIVSIGFIRPFAAWFLCYPAGLGLIGAWFSLLMDQCTRITFTGLRFKSGKWKTIRI